MSSLADDQVHALSRDDVLRARRQSLAEKFLAGPRLFDYACEVTKGMIRREHPGATETHVVEILRRRLALLGQPDTPANGAESE